MKLRHYRRHTFAVCMAWDRCQNGRNALRLVRNLVRWARDKRDGHLEPYPYQGPPLGHVRYCADRMNQGRAKAILLLLDAQLERMKP